MKKEKINFYETNYLGKKAFVLFLLQKIKLATFLLVISIGLVVVRVYSPVEYHDYAMMGIKMGFVLFVLVMILRLVETHVEYRSFSYQFDEEFFQVNYGYVTKNEIAIVYHHIQNAIVKRDIFDRMVGVSKLMVIMDGSKEISGKDIVLPGIDKDRAKLVQKELMRQARIHSVNAVEEKEEEYTYLGGQEV